MVSHFCSLRSVTTFIKMMVRECVCFFACCECAVQSQASGVENRVLVFIATGLLDETKTDVSTDGSGKSFRFLNA